MVTWTKYGETIDAVQYDGTNAADIMAYIDSLYAPNTCNLSGTTLLSPNYNYDIGDWVTRKWSDNPHYGRIAGNLFTTNHFYPFIASGDLISIGIGVVPLLGSNAQATVAVTLQPGFADSSYQAVALVLGGAPLISALSVLSTTVTGSGTVNVVVKNTGLLSLSGASVLVTALHN